MKPSQYTTTDQQLGGGRFLMRIAVAAAACLSLVGVSLADEALASIKQPIDIPAQDLEPALKSFAKQQQLYLIYASEDLATRHTHGASGEFTADQALTQILDGTGLTYRYIDSKTVCILPATSPQETGARQEATGGDTNTTTEGAQKNSFWDRFRLAQAPGGQAPYAVAVSPSNPNPPAESGEPVRLQDQLQEVVVTAEKRAATVQETAASITAVSSEEIADRGIVDFNSLAQSVPGISMRTSGPGQTEFEMRGLNSAGGNTSQVGFYLDETPLSSPASAQLGKAEIDPTLYDLNRVEVLRGPQGTLYGSSSMGGTVKLVPNAPQLSTFAAAGETDVSYTGSGGSINEKINGMLNLPLGETAAVRIVGTQISDSGWIKRLAIQDGAVAVDSGVFPEVTRPANFYTAPLQEEIDGANTTTISSVRISLLWKPLDNLSITPMAMWQLTQQGAPDAVDVNGNPTHPTTPDALAHWEIYDTPEPQRDRFTLGSLKIEYQAPGFTITSATAFWNRNTLVSQDSTEENAAAVGIPVYDAPGGIGPTGPEPNGPATTEKDFTRQISEELRVTSTGSGPFQWILGYFYQDLYSEWDSSTIAPQATPILGGTNLYVDYEPQVITQNAEFGEASWQFTPDLKGTVGLRHYHYSLDQTNEEYGVFTVYGSEGDSVPYNTSFSNSASGTDPKFDLSYNVNADVLLYATAAKGFRLGGANQPIPVALPPNSNSVLTGNECGLQQKLLLIGASQCFVGANAALLLQAPATFSSDSVWNYEIGEKSTFFDRRLIANVSAYYERWTNPQLATNLAGFGITANGGDARIYGLEAELQARLTREWTLGANLGLTNAKFTEASAITGYPEGYNVPDIPAVTASATLRWKHPLTGDLSLAGTLEEDYVGTRTDAPYGETITLLNIDQYLIHLPSYALANLRFGVSGSAWSAMLYVNNITNKIVLLDPQPQIDLQMNAYVRYLVNRPITAGLDLAYKF
jgi:iron complex outermembrane recepter protein